MIGPIAPHFSEELWQCMGNKESIFKSKWPECDPKMLIEDVVEIVVQINGKVRLKLNIPADIDEEKLKSLVISDEKLAFWLQGKSIRNFIYVPKKLINIVV